MMAAIAVGCSRNWKTTIGTEKRTSALRLAYTDVSGALPLGGSDSAQYRATSNICVAMAPVAPGRAVNPQRLGKPEGLSDWRGRAERALRLSHLSSSPVSPELTKSQAASRLIARVHSS